MIARARTFNPWHAASLLVPLASILAAILMMPLPIGLKFWGQILMPSLPVIAIFLWTLYRPDLLPPVAVLLLGFFSDLLIHGPVGVSSLVYLAVYSITLNQRVYWTTLRGTGLIGGFFFVLLIAELLQWGATSFAFGRLLNPVPAVIELAVSMLVLPIARAVFRPLERLVGPGTA
jgi:rod shape-determining protein MreD